jgi:branched-subunit amino acid aminotransferase/4-amino-4-deoxychorismate lyase
MNNSIAYYCGRWVPNAELAFPIDDVGFLMGATLTERLRTFRGRPYRTDAHLARLHHSLELVGWGAEAICAEVGAAIEEFAERNAPLIAEGDDWNIVVFVTPGATADAQRPTICVHGFPIPFHQWANQFVDGLDAVFATERQVPANCWPSELKCRSRMHYYLADREAARCAPRAQAILRDQEGFVCEGSTANVIAYFPERGLVTPYLAKVLPGVSQQVVFELARELGIPHLEGDFTPEEFATADEIYFTSTSICLLPVVKLEGLPVGTGMPGGIYRRLVAAWSERVGVDIAAQAQKFAVR